MLVKLNIVDTKSKVVFKTSITFVNDNDTIVNFFKSKKINQDDVIEFKMGNSFSDLVCLDSEAFNDVQLKELKETVTGSCILHLKIIVR